jgi:glycerate dehydrogenase
MKIAFLDTQLMGPDIDLSAFKSLGDIMFYESTTPEQVADRIEHADVIITNKVKLDTFNLSVAKNLKMVALTCTGTDGVDLEYAKERGIAVANVAGYSTASVVEQTFALLFELMRHTAWHDQFVKTDYQKNNSGMITTFDRSYNELAGKTWGIIGLGGIGKKVATIAEAFEAQVVYHSTSGKNTEGPYPHLNLKDLCAQCDIISIHAPLNDRTKNLINMDNLSLMKSSALILNLGRGGIINEADLAVALDKGEIAGAGLDVFAQEPIQASNPLLHLKHPERLITSPHIAWASIEARQRLAAEVIVNIEAFVADKERNRIV